MILGTQSFDAASQTVYNVGEGQTYSTIQSAIDAVPRNLAGLGEQRIVIHRKTGSAPWIYTGNIILEGGDEGIQNASANDFVRLTVAEADRHNGVAGTGVQVLLSAGENVGITLPYSIFEWLDIKGSDGDGVVDCKGANVLLQNLIVHDNIVDDDNNGITCERTGIIVRNCIVYNIAEHGIIANLPGIAVTVQNVTVFNCGDCGIDVHNGATINVQNCISMNCGVKDFRNVGSTWGLVSNNMSSDNSAPGADYMRNKSAEEQFVLLAPLDENFRILPTSDALDAGSNLHDIFVNDITGRERTDVQWDIGAFEFKKPNPFLLSQPVDIMVNEGESATLSISARAVPAPAFQWYKGFDPIEGEENQTLFIEHAEPEDQGYYYCRVASGYDTVASERAHLEVIEIDTTVQTPLPDSDGDGIPDAVEDALGQNPPGLAITDNWNNNSSINARRSFVFSHIQGYSSRAPIPSIFPSQTISTAHTVLIQALEDPGIPDPDFGGDFVRFGRYFKLTTEVEPGSKIKIGIPFPDNRFFPGDFLKVRVFNGTTWNDAVVTKVTSNSFYIELSEFSTLYIAAASSTKNVLYVGDWGTIEISLSELSSDLLSGNYLPYTHPLYGRIAVEKALEAAELRRTDGVAGNEIYEIWVTENNDLRLSEPDKPYKLVYGVNLVGGFAAGGATYREDRDPKKYWTRLSGKTVLDETAYTVIEAEHFVTNDGFEIAGGNASMYDSGDPRKYCGGGLYVNEKRDITITNCIFRDNVAKAMNGSQPVSRGGAVYCRNSAVLFKNCLFWNNESNSEGGAAYVEGRHPVAGASAFSKCDFVGNHAEGLGGAVSNESSCGYIYCTFLENSSGELATGKGGAFYNHSGAPEQSAPRLIHCTFSGNESFYSGAAVAGETAGEIEMLNCIAWMNTVRYSGTPNEFIEIDGGVNQAGVDVNYCDIRIPGTSSLFPYGTGNINVIPLFDESVPAQFIVSHEGMPLWKPLAVRLQQESACIDAGDAGEEQQNNKFPGDKPDMGAYEYSIVMELGNSITYGYGSKVSGGYRTFLSRIAPGNVYIPVCSPGRRIEDIEDAFVEYKRNINYPAHPLYGRPMPNVVLLIGGTNDINDLGEQVDDALINLDQLITTIKTGSEQGTKIFVASVPLFEDQSEKPGEDFVGPGTEDNARQYNYDFFVDGISIPGTDGGVKNMQIIDDIDVYFVDIALSMSILPQGVPRPNPYYMVEVDDGVHPNTNGYKKIADFWYSRAFWLR
ncbi:MAG: hypothetical protein GF350_13610 [Chitinivibrionales bacterium]|nr:hypothetical protein [Chitinivibrionales bacterium]